MYCPARRLNVVASLGVILGLVMPSFAHAHRLRAECHVLPNHRVQVEGWFERDSAPEGAEVRVMRADGSTLAEGALDGRGVYTFTFDRPEPLKVIVSDGQGHRAEIQLTAEDLSCTAGPVSEFGRAPLSNRAVESPAKDVLIGVGFLLALGAFVLSLRNAHQLRQLKAVGTPRPVEPPTVPGRR